MPKRVRAGEVVVVKTTPWAGVNVVYWSFTCMTVADESNEYVVPDIVTAAPPGTRVWPSTTYSEGVSGVGFALLDSAKAAPVLAMGVNVLDPMMTGSRTAGGLVICIGGALFAGAG